MSDARIALRLAVALTMLALGSALAAAEPGQEPPAPAQDDDGKVYFDLDVPLVGGGRLLAADLRGKVLVVDVWGTWCSPCRRIIPHLIDIQRRFGPLGVMVIGVSAERGENVEEASRKVLRYAADIGMNYTLGIFDPDLYQWIHALMKFETDEFTVPSTFIVEGDGLVVARFPGWFPGQE